MFTSLILFVIFIPYIWALRNLDFSFVEMPFLSCQVYVAIKYQGRKDRLTRAAPGTNVARRKIACNSAAVAFCQTEGAGNIAIHGRFSCDEYPMAATEEGGENAVTGCVPLCENSYQGEKMRDLYRVVDVGIQFDVTTSGANDVVCTQYINFNFPSAQSLNINDAALNMSNLTLN